MAVDYPYVLTIGKLKDFLTMLKSAGVPKKKVNSQYVNSLGFKSSNHKRFPSVLRFLGLIDTSGQVTDRYRAALRDPQQGPGKMAGYIREAYSELFETYPDAHRKDIEALRNFFSSRTDLGDRAMDGMVATFQVLCELADFGKVVEAEKPPEAAAEPLTKRSVAQVSAAGHITVNVNIQLELPADPKVYDELFAAMAKHIKTMREG